MNPFLGRQPLVVALAVAAAVLLTVLGFETGFGTRLRTGIPATTARAPAAQSKLLPPLAASDAEQLYPETTARPLFIATRRPAPKQEAAQQSAMKRGQFQLQGVTIAGDIRIALLREKSSGRIHRVEKGKDINGMKLAEVSPESVTLAQGGEQEVLPLQVQKYTPGATTSSTGPFGAPGGFLPPGTPTPAGAAPVAPQQPQSGFGPHPSANNPLSVAPRVNPAPPANSVAPQVPQASTSMVTPEELLARRRALRNQ